MDEFQPRAGQRQALEYSGGKMGISAVPGSGKTRTLAELAARLVAEKIGDDQEVLVVTLVNSAVDNLRRQINSAIKTRGLLPDFGYRVRTLHGLAHDIVRERPALVGLSEDFGIIDEREADAILRDAVEAWLRFHADAADPYLAADVEGQQAEWIKRGPWQEMVYNIAAAVIRRAKDLQYSPEPLLERLRRWDARLSDTPKSTSLDLARMGIEIYADYQRSLAYRGAVDFADLIRLALEAVQRDAEYLARLRRRWPYILEDEAQDSSENQEQILRLLVGDGGNWVRVGDSNQAVYETFTNANPRFLRQFVDEPGVQRVELSESGRSQPAIISLANFLVRWATKEDQRNPVFRGAVREQYIQTTGPGDPQPNPAEDPTGIQLVDQPFSPDAELKAVADSLQRWLPGHQDCTVAVLVPRNERGFELLELLRQREIEHVELLRSTSDTRHTAGALGNLVHSLADPLSARKLATACEVWRREERDDPDSWRLVKAAAKRIAACPAVEAYLWPRADHDWLGLVTAELPGDEIDLLSGFRTVACRWHRAAVLPIDQLLLTLAGDLFHVPSELALAYKLALLLRDVAAAHPSYRLPELVEELEVIARNERRFLGFASGDTGFEPPLGKVTVSTMHKAKGLQWDRVYLLSVNNYDFPSGAAGDTFIAERRFIRDNLNLEAEALAQLGVIVNQPTTTDQESGQGLGRGPYGNDGPALRAGEATLEARKGYIAERLRLLYVAITRARRDLIITWNTGGHGPKLQPAATLIALQEYWRARALVPAPPSSSAEPGE